MTESNFTSISNRPVQKLSYEDIQMPNCPKINNWPAVWKQYLCDDSLPIKENKTNSKIIQTETSICDETTENKEHSFAYSNKNENVWRNDHRDIPTDKDQIFNQLRDSVKNVKEKSDNVENSQVERIEHLSDKYSNVNNKGNNSANKKQRYRDNNKKSRSKMKTDYFSNSNSTDNVNYSNKQPQKFEKNNREIISSSRPVVHDKTYVLNCLERSIEINDKKNISNDLKKMKFSKAAQIFTKNPVSVEQNCKVQSNWASNKKSNDKKPFQSCIPILKHSTVFKKYKELNKVKNKLNPISNKMRMLSGEKEQKKIVQKMILDNHVKEVTSELKHLKSVQPNNAFKRLSPVKNHSNANKKNIRQDKGTFNLTYIIENRANVMKVAQNDDTILKNIQKNGSNKITAENSVIRQSRERDFSDYLSKTSSADDLNRKETSNRALDISGNTFIIDRAENSQKTKEFNDSNVFKSLKPNRKSNVSPRKSLNSTKNEFINADIIRNSENQHTPIVNNSVGHKTFSKENKENRILHQSAYERSRSFTENTSPRKKQDSLQRANCVKDTSKENANNTDDLISKERNKKINHKFSQREKETSTKVYEEKVIRDVELLELNKISNDNIWNTTLKSKHRAQKLNLNDSEYIFKSNNVSRSTKIPENTKFGNKSTSDIVSLDSHESSDFVFEKRPSKSKSPVAKKIEPRMNISGETYILENDSRKSNYLKIVNTSDSLVSITVPETTPLKSKNIIEKKNSLEKNLSSRTRILENDHQNSNRANKLKSRNISDLSDSFSEDSDVVTRERSTRLDKSTEKKVSESESNFSFTTNVIDSQNRLVVDKKKPDDLKIIKSPESTQISQKTESATLKKSNKQCIHQIDVPVMVHRSFLDDTDFDKTVNKSKRKSTYLDSIQNDNKKELDKNIEAALRISPQSSKIDTDRESYHSNYKSVKSVQEIDQNINTASECSFRSSNFDNTNRNQPTESFGTENNTFRKLYFSSIDSDEEDLENCIMEMCDKRNKSYNKQHDVFKIPFNPTKCLKPVVKKRSSIFNSMRSSNINHTKSSKDKIQIMKNYFFSNPNKQSTGRYISNMGNSIKRNTVNCFSTNVEFENNFPGQKTKPKRMTSIISNSKRHLIDVERNSFDIRNENNGRILKQFRDETGSVWGSSIRSIEDDETCKKNLNREEDTDSEIIQNHSIEKSVGNKKSPVKFVNRSNDLDSSSSGTYIVNKDEIQHSRYGELNNMSINKNKKLSIDAQNVKHIPDNYQLKNCKVYLTRIDSVSVVSQIHREENSEIFQTQADNESEINNVTKSEIENDTKKSTKSKENNDIFTNVKYNTDENGSDDNISSWDSNKGIYLSDKQSVDNCTEDELDNSEIFINKSKKTNIESNNSLHKSNVNEITEVYSNSSSTTTNLSEECLESRRNEIIENISSGKKKTIINKYDENTRSKEYKTIQQTRSESTLRSLKENSARKSEQKSNRTKIENRSDVRKSRGDLELGVIDTTSRYVDTNKLTPEQHSESSQESMDKSLEPINVVKRLNFDFVQGTSTPKMQNKKSVKKSKYSKNSHRIESPSDISESSDDNSDMSNQIVEKVDRNNQDISSGMSSKQNVLYRSVEKYSSSSSDLEESRRKIVGHVSRSRNERSRTHMEKYRSGVKDDSKLLAKHKCNNRIPTVTIEKSRGIDHFISNKSTNRSVNLSRSFKDINFNKSNISAKRPEKCTKSESKFYELSNDSSESSDSNGKFSIFSNNKKMSCNVSANKIQSDNRLFETRRSTNNRSKLKHDNESELRDANDSQNFIERKSSKDINTSIDSQNLKLKSSINRDSSTKLDKTNERSIKQSSSTGKDENIPDMNVFVSNYSRSNFSDCFSIDEISVPPQLKSTTRKNARDTVLSPEIDRSRSDTQRVYKKNSAPFINRNECADNLVELSRNSVEKINNEKCIKTTAKSINMKQCRSLSEMEKSDRMCITPSNTVSEKSNRHSTNPSSKESCEFKEPLSPRIEMLNRCMERNQKTSSNSNVSKRVNQCTEKTSFSSGYGTNNSNDVMSVDGANTNENLAVKMLTKATPMYNLTSTTNRSEMNFNCKNSDTNSSKFFSTKQTTISEYNPQSKHDDNWTDDISLEISIANEQRSSDFVKNSEHCTIFSLEGNPKTDRENLNEDNANGKNVKELFRKQVDNCIEYNIFNEISDSIEIHDVGEQIVDGPLTEPIDMLERSETANKTLNNVDGFNLRKVESYARKSRSSKRFSARTRNKSVSKSRKSTTSLTADDNFSNENNIYNYSYEQEQAIKNALIKTLENKFAIQSNDLAKDSTNDHQEDLQEIEVECSPRKISPRFSIRFKNKPKTKSNILTNKSSYVPRHNYNTRSSKRAMFKIEPADSSDKKMLKLDNDTKKVTEVSTRHTKRKVAEDVDPILKSAGTKTRPRLTKSNKRGEKKNDKKISMKLNEKKSVISPIIQLKKKNRPKRKQNYEQFYDEVVFPSTNPLLKLKRKLYSSHLESPSCSSLTSNNAEKKEKRDECSLHELLDCSKCDENRSDTLLKIEELKELKVLIDRQLETLNKNIMTGKPKLNNGELDSPANFNEKVDLLEKTSNNRQCTSTPNIPNKRIVQLKPNRSC